MGLCENTRSWRWRGSAASFRAVIGAVLLGLSMAQTCPAGETHQNLTLPSYLDPAEKHNGVEFMASFVRSFLQTLQPNVFPTGRCHDEWCSLAAEDFTYSLCLWVSCCRPPEQSGAVINHMKTMWISMRANIKVKPGAT